MALCTYLTYNCKGNVNLSSDVLRCSPSFPTVVFKHFINATVCVLPAHLSAKEATSLISEVGIQGTEEPCHLTVT